MSWPTCWASTSRRRLQNNDVVAVGRIADAWNTIWDLKPGINSAMVPVVGTLQVGFGPSRRHGGAGGERPLVGDQADHQADHGVAARRRRRAAAQGRHPWTSWTWPPGLVGGLTVPGSYQRSDTPSAGIQQLIFSGQGPLAAPAARRALALCTPRNTIAARRGPADRQRAPQSRQRRRVRGCRERRRQQPVRRGERGRRPGRTEQHAADRPDRLPGAQCPAERGCRRRSRRRVRRPASRCKTCPPMAPDRGR